MLVSSTVKDLVAGAGITDLPRPAAQMGLAFSGDQTGRPVELTGRTRCTTAVRILLAAALCAGLVVVAGADAGTRGLHGNNFFVNCRFSHTSNDDPIVLPGMPGRSHAHTFFGNRSTDARSTLASLRAAGTTCKPAADKAAYWVPTLYQDGKAIRPAKGQFYYNLRGYQRMAAFPGGAEDGRGPGTAGDSPVNGRRLVGMGRQRRGAQPEVRPCSRSLRNHPHDLSRRTRKCPTCPLVPATFGTTPDLPRAAREFPDCWDGRHLDSPDHRSHMAYSRNYVCPASHPVKVPAIRLMIRYPVRDGAGVELASGGQLTGHADFFNAWNQTALAHLVDVCFHDRPATTCGARTRLAARQPPGPRSQAHDILTVSLGDGHDRGSRFWCTTRRCSWELTRRSASEGQIRRPPRLPPRASCSGC